MRIFKGVTLFGLAVVCLAVLLAPRPGLASLKLSSDQGPPTTVIQIWGQLFYANELVDIYLDETPVKLVAADAAGQFGFNAVVKVTIPKTATPDCYFITAVGRKSGWWDQLPFYVCTDWAQFRFDYTHKGCNPYENLLSPANVAGLERWFSLATGAAIDASPAVSHDIYGMPMITVASRDGKVYLAKPYDALEWYATKSATGAGPIYASPAVYKDKAYVAYGNGEGWVWDYATSKWYWICKTQLPIYGAPTVTPSGLYVATGTIYYKLDLTNGHILYYDWEEFKGQIYASPTVGNGLVFVASADGTLRARDFKTSFFWEVPLCVGVPGLASTPAVSNGMVYVGAPTGKLHARYALTGAEVWTFLAGGPIFSSPAVAKGRVYFGANDGYLYCLDAAFGKQIWKSNTGGKVYSSPAVANGVVYVGSDSGRVFAFHAASGARLWSAPTNGMIRSSPVVADGVLYVTSYDKRLYAYALDGIGAQSPWRRKAKRLPPDPLTLVPDPNLKLE